MGLLVWIAQTALADWVRVSFIGYPMMITSHAIGMATMVGLALTLELRLLGALRTIPVLALHRLLRVAWLGFGLNFLSGTALFTSDAVSFATSGSFQLKISLVLAGAITVAYIQTAISRDPDSFRAATPTAVRVVATVSIVLWISALLVGRLTAYI